MYILCCSGSGIFVTTVVVGSIVLSSKFTLTTRPFLRDVIFYIIAVFCSFYTIWDQRMYWWEGAGMVSSVAGDNTHVCMCTYISTYRLCSYICCICTCCPTWTTDISKISQEEAWKRKYFKLVWIHVKQKWLFIMLFL